MAPECPGCILGCDIHFPWKCDECGWTEAIDQDSEDATRCEPCANDNRKFLAMQKRRDDLEAAADYEYDRRKDDGEY